MPVKTHARLAHAALLALCCGTLGGCMSVEMPKHMVSDTVDASVRVYDRVTGANRDAPGLEIAWTAVFDDNTTVEAATRQCYEQLTVHARTSLRNDRATITVMGETLRKYGRLFSVECRVRAANT